MNRVAAVDRRMYYTAGMRTLTLAFLAALLMSGAVLAQGDSLRVVAPQTVMVGAKPKRSPMGALLRSVAVPGWGQYYNRKFLKSAVIFGAESYFIYRAAYWWVKAEDQYDQVRGFPESQQALEFNRYLTYRSSRNDYLWLTGITVFVSMFDAYVDAHLAGFDVDLTPEFQPPSEAMMLTLSLRF